MGLAVSEMRQGMVILHEGELYEITRYEHSKRGRGGAIARTRLRNLRTGRVMTTTFRGSENTESVFMESRLLQYLYKKDDDYIFMDSERFNQFPVSAKLLCSRGTFIVEGITVTGYFHNDKLIKVDIPNFIELEVAKTEPGVKGDSVSNVEKAATLESGAVIKVPLFIKTRDKVKVDTRSGEYVERL